MFFFFGNFQLEFLIYKEPEHSNMLNKTAFNGKDMKLTI